MKFPFRSHTKKLIEAEREAIKKSIGEVIDNGSYHAYNGHVEVIRFEAALSDFFKNPVVAVNSGTDALILALHILNIGEEDEVIVPAFSFISTASVVPWIGATPVFVDINETDFAINPKEIEQKITPRTKAIIVAHLFGHPATGIEHVMDIAKKRNLYVIEDAAQSFGARILLRTEKSPAQQKILGTIGDIGCFSFSSTKTFSAPGNGGALIIKNPQLYIRGKEMRSYGMNDDNEYVIPGVNNIMHDVQAAALTAKLRFQKHWLSQRTRVARYYTENLTGIGDLILPKGSSESESIYYRYVIRTKSRDGLFEYLKKSLPPHKHLQPSKNYPTPLPHLPLFKYLHYNHGEFPVSEQVSSEVLSLPISNTVTVRDAALICSVVRSFFAA